MRVLAVTVVGQTVWALVDYAAFVREGYSKSPIVYRCLRLIADMASATPLLLSGEPLEKSSGPLAAVLRQPSDTVSGPDLIEQEVISIMLAGEAFVEGMTLRGDLVELATMRPDFVKVVPAADGSVARYEFDSGSGKQLYPVPLPNGRGEAAFSRVCHIRLFHPTDQWRGHSPMLAASSAILEHNGAGDYARALLKNAARPSGALVYAPRDPQAAQNLTDDQFERLRKELEENHQGAANTGRPMLLDGGLSWVPMALTPDEMKSPESRSASAREVALALGVPPLLLGLPGDNTFANYQEANRALWRQTVLPLLNKITARKTRWVQPLYPGAVIAVDVEGAPISAEERKQMFETVKGADFLTLDEKRATVGYQPLPEGKGKVIVIPASLTTLDDVVAASGADPAQAGAEAYGSDDPDPEPDADPNDDN